MKDEEMAEQYAQNLEKELMKEYEEHSECGQTSYLATIPTLHAKQAFLAGLKAGRPQWHEITDWKNNEQFPDNICKTYLVYINLKYLKIKQYVVCTLDITEGCRQFYFDDGSEEDIDPEDVIAWCEIPIFDKE